MPSFMLYILAGFSLVSVHRSYPAIHTGTFWPLHREVPENSYLGRCWRFGNVQVVKLRSSLQLPGQTTPPFPQIIPFMQALFLFHMLTRTSYFHQEQNQNIELKSTEGAPLGTINLIPEFRCVLKPGQLLTGVGGMRYRHWAWPTLGRLFRTWLALHKSWSNSDLPNGSRSCRSLVLLWFCFSSHTPLRKH